MMATGSGHPLVVNNGPESALQIPKAVSGNTMDLRSFLVTSHTVRRWYGNDFLSFSFLSVSLSNLEIFDHLLMRTS